MRAEQIDCRRLLCPMPVIRVQDRIERLDPGTLVDAVCSDPGVLQDIPAWCRLNGHEVLEALESDDHTYVVRFRVAFQGDRS